MCIFIETVHNRCFVFYICVCLFFLLQLDTSIILCSILSLAILKKIDKPNNLVCATFILTYVMSRIKTRLNTTMTDYPNKIFRVPDPITVYHIATNAVIYDKEGDTIRTNDIHVFVQGDVVIFNMWLVEDLLYGGQTTSEHMYVVTCHDKFVDDVTEKFRKVTNDVIDCDDMDGCVGKFFGVIAEGICNMSCKEYTINPCQY